MTQRVVKAPEGDPPPAGTVQQTGYETDGNGNRYAIYLVDDDAPGNSSAGTATATWVYTDGETIGDITATTINDEWPDQQQDVA